MCWIHKVACFSWRTSIGSLLFFQKPDLIVVVPISGVAVRLIVLLSKGFLDCFSNNENSINTFHMTFPFCRRFFFVHFSFSMRFISLLGNGFMLIMLACYILFCFNGTKVSSLRRLYKYYWLINQIDPELIYLFSSFPSRCCIGTINANTQIYL